MPETYPFFAGCLPAVVRAPVSGPWGQDDASSVVAVVIETDGRGARVWRPIDAALARAINSRQVASFNLFLSLAPAERAMLATLYAATR